MPEDQITFVLNDSLKKGITDIANENYSKVYVYSTTFTKLNKTIILTIMPVYDSDYLKYKGFPFSFYEDGSNLFLIYCGLESTLRDETGFKLEIQKKYDSTCKKNKIGELEATHDAPTLFLKIEDQKIMTYNNYEFQEIFFERRKVEPISEY